jgi:hydroxypyruvate reductase
MDFEDPQRRRLKQQALAIFRAGLEAVDAGRAVERSLRREGTQLIVGRGLDERSFDLSRDFSRVVIVGAGKAVVSMTRAVTRVFHDYPLEGIVVTKADHGRPCSPIAVLEAAHPLPDHRGVAAAQKIMNLLAGADSRTLVVALFSGGGSALLPLPAAGITLADKQAVTDGLLAAGAPIDEINAVRKHLSAIKGGQLARAAAPATVVSLFLSDVVGDHLETIASGPTVADHSTFADAQRVLRDRGVAAKVPAVDTHLARGIAGEISETVKSDGQCLKTSHAAVIGSNRLALEACRHLAEAQGWRTLVLSSEIQGEAREVARVYAAMAREIRRHSQPLAAPACLIAGGETTVTLHCAGRGGRNQELALAAALDLQGEKGMAVLSAGTDGTDGPTDAAGALAYGDSLIRGGALGLEGRRHLAQHNAYPFFESLGDLVHTGPTDTNVMDIHLVLVAPL